MKVVCDRGALVEALKLARGAVVARSPKPVLGCVKLSAETDDGMLHVAATDMEVGLHLSTPRVEVEQAGEAVLPADKLLQIVNESNDPTLTIEMEHEAAHIRGQDSHFKVFGYPPADFPAVMPFSGDSDFEIAAATLRQLIEQTQYATARENTRYAINGVLLEREGNKLCVVATDGHRLALARGPYEPTGDESGGSAIIPPKALNMLMSLLDDPEQAVRVRIADSQIIFGTDNATLWSNLVEGNFPPYKDVIPKDADRKATLATDALHSAVRRAAVLTNEESKGVRFAFQPDGLTLSSRAPEMGEAEIKVDLPKFDGEPIEIGFNPGYLLDALKVTHAEHVTMDLRAPNKPGVLRSGPDFLYVIMPVNLQ